MNKIRLIRINLFLFLIILFNYNLQAHDSNKYGGSDPTSFTDWETITLPEHDVVQDPNNPDQIREIQTGCAFSGQTNERYKFYYKQGDKEKLLIYFNGGGACWSDHTCLTSLKAGDRPTYNPTTSQENDPVFAAGIMDFNRKENPFKDWSMIFLPYCTGDIHIGSKNSTYTDITGLVTDTPGTPVTVGHRGFDNVLGAKKWIKQNLVNRRNQPAMSEILIAGSSAGGYGAVFNFPHIKNTFKNATVNLISDSSANILTQEFLDEVFTAGSTWGLENNIMLSISGFDNFGNYDANVLNETFFGGLSTNYPKSNFGQYSPAWDAVQVQFLKIMQNPNNPAAWNQLGPDTFCEWNARMKRSLYSTSSNSNYRYYIGAGTTHVALVDAFGSERFYSENSGDEKFTKWTKNTTRNEDDNWLNRECTDCAAPFPLELCQIP